MDPRDSRTVTEAARRVAEEAAQAVRRSIALGAAATTATARRTGFPGSFGAPGPSLAGEASRLVARGPLGMAYEAVDLACRVVESACAVSRRMAGAVLGQEQASLGPAPPASGPYSQGAAFWPRSVAAGAGGPADSAAPRTPPEITRDDFGRRQSVTSPLLRDTSWAAGVAPPATVAVAPGGLASVRIYVDNRSSTAMRSVRLRSTDLVSPGGGLIDDTAVEIQPAVVDLAPQCPVAVDVEILVPTEAPRGRYTGVIAAIGLPAASSAFEIEVR